jgi:hypothetical protein
MDVTRPHGYSAIDDDLFLPTGYYTDSQQMDIVFDSGCTTSVTPNKSDFVGDITEVHKIMQGLSSTTKITGEGMIKWKIRDDFGVEQIIEVNGLLVPESKVRLFSPQSYFNQVQGGSFNMDSK